MKTRQLTLIAATLLFSLGAVAQRGSGTFTSPRTTISSGSVGGSMSSGSSSGGSWNTRSGSSAPSSGGSSRSESSSGSNSWNGGSRSNSSSGSSSGSIGSQPNTNNRPVLNNGMGTSTGIGSSSPVYDNTRTSGASDEQVRSTALKDIRNTLSSLDKSNQSYRVSGTEPSTVTGLGGTMIRINPNDLETATGQPITGDIEVNLKELDGPAKMGLAGTPTMSNGEMLVSGGSYYFGMSSGGQEVKLKEGKSMEVTLPQLENTEPDMELFVGEVDKNGNVNWQPVNQPLTPGYAPNPNGEMPNNGNTGGNSNGSNSNSTTGRENTANMPTRGNTGNTNNSGNNNATGNRPANPYFQPINITSMGYVNADKYVRGGVKMNVEVENADPAATQVYLVFKNRRSLVEGQPEQGFVSNNFLFNSVPRNEEIKVVAISKSNGKTYAGEVYTNTKDKKQFVTLNPVNDSYLSKAFEYTK